MTRGRTQNHTIPPTRALIQQREYRSRRQKHVADLEERCRRAEAENEQLKKEIAELKAARSEPMFWSPQAVQTSKELLRNLAATASSLKQFDAIMTSANLVDTSSHLQRGHVPSANNICIPDLASPTESSQASPTAVERSECCGGFVDCESLVKDGIIQEDCVAEEMEPP